MKKKMIYISIISFLLILVLPLQAKAATVLLSDLTLTADCAAEASPENFYWEIGWNDEFVSRADLTLVNESFYKMEAPCKVFFGDTFEVRISATDDVCKTGNFTGVIADTWSLTDTLLSGTPVVTTVDSGSYGSNEINVYPSGVWEMSYMRPTPSADNHDFAFAAKDLGHCGGGHSWTGSVSQGTVVDPVRGPVNTAPEAFLYGSGVYELGTALRLRATVSDLDGDVLTYRLLDNGSAIDSGTVQTIEGGAPVALPLVVIGNGLSLGVHNITLIVSDGTDSVESSIDVEYVDTTAPTLAPVSDTNKLWPPNNNVHPVTVTVNAADNSGESPRISATVASNGGGAGDYSVVSIDQSAGTVDLLLKASSGKGREYTVTVNAMDASGNSGSASVTIRVAR